jgi:Flp pilus assembly protein TadG
MATILLPDGAFIVFMSRVSTILLVRRFRTAANGSTAVEFAMLCPVFILLFLGMTAYGIYFGASHSVQQLSADAARAAIAGVDTAERQALATGFIERNGNGYAFIDPTLLSVTVGDSVSDPGQFNVRLSYDASNLPIWGLFEGIAMPNQTIERRSTIRVGGI